VIPDFEQRLGTDLASIAALAAAFSSWGARAALTVPEIFQVNIVLEELVTNVIVHGLGVGHPGWVRLRVTHCGDCLALEVRDNAPPFDPFEVPPPKLTPDLDAREVGGLGIHFVRTLMDEWSYARVGSENVVALRKMLGGPR
jgi:serine/threonine-protein kinase RsbW